MARFIPRLGRVAVALLTGVLAAPAAPAAEAVRGFEVLVHLRHPEGREEVLRISDFTFVYYERRYKRRFAGFGKPASLEVRDLPHEIQSIQNEDLDKVRFRKIRSLTLEYREEAGARLLFLVAARISKRKKPVAWPVYLLRNANTARAPHFRGILDGKTLDFPFPPLTEVTSPTEAVMVRVDFQFPGQPPRRKRF